MPVEPNELPLLLPHALRNLSWPFTTQFPLGVGLQGSFVIIGNDYTIPGWAAHDR